MFRFYRLILLCVLLMSSGCLTRNHSSLTQGDQTAGLLIGIKVFSAGSNPYFTVICDGFDRSSNKPLGYFSGRELRFLSSITDKPDICLEDMCYYYTLTAPGDYIIRQLVTGTNSGAFYSVTLSSGTYLFHLEAGKTTYVGDYLIKKDADEPSIAYRSNVQLANQALNTLKGGSNEMLAPAPLHAKFSP